VKLEFMQVESIGQLFLVYFPLGFTLSAYVPKHSTCSKSALHFLSNLQSLTLILTSIVLQATQELRNHSVKKDGSMWQYTNFSIFMCRKCHYQFKKY